VTNRTLLRCLIIAIIALQLVWLIKPKAGSNPIGRRAMEAGRALAEHPSAATRAIFEEESRRGSDRRDWAFVSTTAAVLIVDGLGIYIFWNHGYRRKRIA
jgi:hypothetical protein